MRGSEVVVLWSCEVARLRCYDSLRLACYSLGAKVRVKVRVRARARVRVRGQ